jgi:hypothetical protein
MIHPADPGAGQGEIEDQQADGQHINGDEVKLPFDAQARLVTPKLEGRPARLVHLGGKLDESELLLERAGTYKIEIED